VVRSKQRIVSTEINAYCSAKYRDRAKGIKMPVPLAEGVYDTGIYNRYCAHVLTTIQVGHGS
jgi:hypothetical protein